MQAVALMKTLGSARFMRRMHAGAQISGVEHVDKCLACTRDGGSAPQVEQLSQRGRWLCKAGHSQLNFVPAHHRLSAPNGWQDNKGFSEKIYTSVAITFC